MSNFTEVCKFLKDDYMKDQKTKPEQFSQALKLISEKLHKSIDKAKEELIEYGIKAFEKEHSSKKNDTQGIPNDEGKDVKLKIQDLLASLDNILSRTEYLDDSIKQIQEEPIDKLLIIRKNELSFKQTRKFMLKSIGKVSAEISWLKVQNKPTFSTIDSGDDSNLKIHANGCYNYFATDKSFESEDVEIRIITNCYQVSNYLYFGVMNDTTVPNSNCMCCNPASVTYFRPMAGTVVCNAVSTTENKLMYNNSSRSEFSITMRLMLSDPSNKHVYFQINDNDEVGPYKVIGSRFTFTSGSCNDCSGFMKIESSNFI